MFVEVRFNLRDEGEKIFSGLISDVRCDIREAFIDIDDPERVRVGAIFNEDGGCIGVGYWAYGYWKDLPNGEMKYIKNDDYKFTWDMFNSPIY